MPRAERILPKLKTLPGLRVKRKEEKKKSNQHSMLKPAVWASWDDWLVKVFARK